MNGTLEENKTLQVVKGKLTRVPSGQEISKVYEAETQTEFENIIERIYKNMPDNSQKVVEINLAELGAVLPLGSYRVTICRFYDKYGFVELTSETYGRLFKALHDEWQEWEWDTPPLWTGTEYRLTARYEAQPLYTKVIQTVWRPATTLELEIPNAKLVVDYSARYHDRTLPYVTSSGEIIGFGISTNATLDKVFVEMHGDTASTGTGWFLQIWYIKD